MGAAFSCGKDNDDLINILKRHNYISSKKVERVFRAVDRGDYIFSTHRDQAYKDISCKVGNIHLSAPCVYCRVMEGLSLKPGLSFLNIGSGTGYLSTMAGLILGESGTNHGIEMHEDCLNYAYEHLEEFKRKSLDVDVFEFCEPVFQHGNFLNVMPNRQYDRVYCGAACPQTYEKFVKQFVRIGGILVMPYKDHLLRIKRTGEKTWINYTMLPVSFASLMPPLDTADRGLLQLPLWEPRSLQELCRNSIRSHLRKMVWAENSNLEDKRQIKNLSTENSPPSLRSGLGIPFIDDGVGSYQREVMTTLQLVMSSSMRAVFAESLDGGVYVEQEEQPETSSDSEEDFQSEIERLFAVCESEERNSSRNASNLEAENEDGEDSMEVAGSTKETREVEGENEAAGEQSGSNRDRSIDANAKRESMESDESSEDSSIEDETVSHISGSDELDEEGANFLIIKQVCSMMNPENQRIESSSDSSSSSSSSDSSSGDEGDALDQRPISEASTNTPIIPGGQREVVGNAETKNAPENSQLSPRESNSRSEEIGSKKRVLSPRECETSGKKSSIEDKPDEKDDKPRSSDTSSEDDTRERTNNRRNYRAGQKRRSELDSVRPRHPRMDTSREDESTNYRGSYRPGQKRRSDLENVRLGHNRMDTSSEDETTNYRCYYGPGLKRRSELDNSGRRQNAVAISKKLYKSESRNVQSRNFDNSPTAAFSDSDSEMNYEVCKSKRKQNFAYTIRKELFSSCMKKKIHLLPLPPPLQLYINYNREL